MNIWLEPVDFFASHTHYVEHLAPIYKALDPTLRGVFQVPAILEREPREMGVEARALKGAGVNLPRQVNPEGRGALVVCAYGDLQTALRRNPKRPIIFLEHGVGLSFNHSAYAGGGGLKRKVSLFLDPNENVRGKNLRKYPNTPGEVIGTPKLDDLFTPTAPSVLRTSPPNTAARIFRGEKAVVCISFHWDGSVIAPEAGNALDHYRHALKELAECGEFTLIGHGHPRVMGQLRKVYGALGIEVVEDFREVMRRADLYVNDCSSTLYEFCTTGKPVVILNSPKFRRNVHTGIRFWEYTDVGPQVEKAEELLTVIRSQLTAESEAYAEAREKAVRELYPHLGRSAERAAEAIRDFVSSKRPAVKRVDVVDGQSIGIIYMCFGVKAAAAVGRSMASLRGVGLDIPVCVVGDTRVDGAQFIEWTGQSPFDARQRQNFQFRAGRVKPFLYGLTPFERTLYIDADTEFMGNILPGFEMLGDFEMALAEESLSIGKLYNKPRAGWEINIIERDETIRETGGDAMRKFLNSGVIFFSKCEAVEMVFAEWGRQWLRFEQWDEQLALMRALNLCPVNYKALSIDWNHPHRERARIIFHNYGRGVVRMNVAASAPPSVPPQISAKEQKAAEYMEREADSMAVTG